MIYDIFVGIKMRIETDLFIKKFSIIYGAKFVSVSFNVF